MPESAKIQFTPAQSAAITARGGSLLVSAAAGSGKTRVLVERVVGLITDPIHPVEADSLLIMTFTNAAAAKLRADITTRLAEEVRAHPGDMRLRRQQLLLQRAAIGTVDAFCLHFVQQHFAALNVPPDFTTAEEAELARIEQETLSAVLESAYTDADFRAFADLYDRGRTDNTAGNAVRELYHFSRALPHPAEVLQQFAAKWQQDTPPQDTPWGQNLLAISLQRAQGARALLQAAARTAAKDEAADFAYTAVLQEDADRVTWLCQVLEKGDWDRSVAALGEFDTAWRRAGRIKGGKDGNPCAFAASELRARAKKQIESLRTDFLLCTGEEYAADRRRAAPLVAALVRVTQQFADACFAAKCEEKLLDYADFELLTLDLLLTPDNQRRPLCRTVSSHYSAVLVDEYQDTNATQDMIFDSVSRPDNLFMVGDVKQSIYRFRQAMPEIFIHKRSAYHDYDGQNYPARIVLSNNFRSRSQVTDAINYLFYALMSREVGEIDYDDSEALTPSAVYPEHLQADTEMHLVENRSEELSDPMAEAGYAAQQIKKMLDEGFLVNDHGQMRPVRPGEICILLRSMKNRAQIYENELTRLGVPVWTDSRVGFLETVEISTALSILRAVDNPLIDIHLTAAMMSPVYAFTADEKAVVRMHDRRSHLNLSGSSSFRKRAQTFFPPFCSCGRLPPLHRHIG